jgi:hypothetical protein
VSRNFHDWLEQSDLCGRAALRIARCTEGRRIRTLDDLLSLLPPDAKLIRIAVRVWDEFEEQGGTRVDFYDKKPRGKGSNEYG